MSVPSPSLRTAQSAAPLELTSHLNPPRVCFVVRKVHFQQLSPTVPITWAPFRISSSQYVPLACWEEARLLVMYYYYIIWVIVFPGGASGKEPACQCRRHRDTGLISGSGRCPGGGHGNPLQYSCLENPMDRGAWWAMVHRVTQSQTPLKRLSTHMHEHNYSYKVNTITLE